MKLILKNMLMVFFAVLLFCSVAGCAKKDEGKVYYLNFKPEADEDWNRLANIYTQQTGVDVKVVTAASGDYMNTLNAQMGKSGAPTLFQIATKQDAENWSDYLLDLKNTDVYNELTSYDFNIVDRDGKVAGIGYCYETYGIIVNKKLLEKAGHNVDEINSFESLKFVAEDIHTRRNALGFDAFTSSGLDNSSSWRFSGHLANMPLFYEFRENGITEQPETVTGSYLDCFKNIWDLYINNCSLDVNELSTATIDRAEAEFGFEEAVFFQNGSWEFSNLTNGEKGYTLKPEDLTMIPIYCGAPGEENAGLCSGTENCWAVNATSSEKDIKATLDFLYWVVTSEEGTTMLADTFGVTPFKNAKRTDNVFLESSAEYIDKGNYTVSWVFGMTPNVDAWRSGFVSALLEYSAGKADWEKVETAFSESWANQYKIQHG